MDRQTLLLKAMTYDYPEEIPFSIGILPAVWKQHENEIRELVRQYSGFFHKDYVDYNYREQMSERFRVGSTVDEWGCVWSNIEEGLNSMVTGHPVKTREDIRRLVIPTDRDGNIPHGFFYLRLLDLRGFEEIMLDFAEECGELQILIDKVVEYNCIQLEKKIENTGQIVYFGDDLGMQKGLAIGPEKWRKYLKPGFKKIYDMVRRAGKYVYMHTDGMIYEIIPDLFECGVQMVNPQYRANGLENLLRVCRGKYPINLDLDRQLFPFASPGECKEHVRQCVEAFYMPSGGLAINIEIGPDIPIANVEALLQAADEYRTFC